MSFLNLKILQRLGIILLIVLLFLILGGILFYRNNITKKEKLVKTSQPIQVWIDSLKETHKQNQEKGYTYKIYPFNPNFISAYKGYRLGLSSDEIKRLHNFRAKDKWINSVADFQRVTGVSDSLLKVISSYFKFPEWVVKQQKRLAQKKQSKSPYVEKKDLNTVSYQQLVALKGIGNTLAKRILNYRNKLGYFVDDIQLKDIYGLTYERRKMILKYFTVKSHKNVHKVNLNTAFLEDLMTVPYFDYELARAIRNYRLTHEGFKTIQELTKIENFPSAKLEQVKLYITLEED